MSVYPPIETRAYAFIAKNATAMDRHQLHGGVKALYEAHGTSRALATFEACRLVCEHESTAGEAILVDACTSSMLVVRLAGGIRAIGISELESLAQREQLSDGETAVLVAPVAVE